MHRKLQDCGRESAIPADGSWVLPAVLALLASALPAVPGLAQAPVRMFPADDHFASFRPYLEGDFVEARKAFVSVPRLKSTEGVWVDSIPYHTMIGECMYHMGDLAGAMEQYEFALRVFLTYPDWLMRLNLPEGLTPSARAGRRGPVWGASARGVRVAQMPDRIGLLMGNADEDNLRALQQGGVVSTRYMVMVNASEIVRCTALAMRRRAEILGPVGEYDTLTNDLVSMLSRRPAPPNHWSQAWISVQLGIAYAGKGKRDDAAKELTNGLLAAGMDHNLTATALLELGKLAFDAKDYPAANLYFYEATYSAAMMAEDDFTQYEVVAEAFRGAMISHAVIGQGTFYQPLGAAVEWATRGYRIVEASLLLSAAESCTSIGDAGGAATYLDRAAQVMRLSRRRELIQSELGARFQFVTAQASAQSGDSARAGTALANALAYQRRASRWLFQIAAADAGYAKGGVTTHQAGQLYAEVLRDPTAQDWGYDPLECLSVLTTPHPGPYERWMLMALDRKENDVALRISEALRRHRFCVSLSLGGRIMNLRWTLEAPSELLPQSVQLQRQDLLNRYPAYAALSQQVAQLRMELAALIPGGANAADQARATEVQTQLEQASASLEKMLEAMAVSREPNEPVFPPVMDVALVQQRLTPEQRALVYISTSNATFAFMLGPEKYSTWKLEAPTKIKSDIAAMLRQMGQYDRNQPLGLKELTDETWKTTAVSVLKDLTANAPAEAWNEFQELIVVPDGLLWYVPFEALQIEDKDQRYAVIEKVRVRYAPTISLAVPDERPRPRVARTAVVAGSLFPREGETLATEFLTELKADDPNVFGVAAKPAPASALLAKVVDRLIVLSDLDNDAKGPYDWAPLSVDRGTASGSLAQWMKLPWGGPDQLLLPGFHTPAENALKRGGGGNEMFLAACGLMSTGSRTILLSRWRDGGRTTYDLMREFVRELPHRSACDAWQRAVRLAVSTDLLWAVEPRVKEVPPETPPMKAEHPFFWSGYMLIDTGVEPE